MLLLLLHRTRQNKIPAWIKIEQHRSESGTLATSESYFVNFGGSKTLADKHPAGFDSLLCIIKPGNDGKFDELLNQANFLDLKFGQVRLSIRLLLLKEQPGPITQSFVAKSARGREKTII
jgi:hypothetical protein